MCRRVYTHLGIIPAYAGNTAQAHVDNSTQQGSSPHTRGTLELFHSLLYVTKDHPRIRGEHHWLVNCNSCVHGIIPAYAGNTRTRCLAGCAKSGSSPHTRGTHLITSRFSGYSYNTQSLLQMSSAESICFPMLARPAPAASRCSNHCLRF